MQRDGAVYHASKRIPHSPHSLSFDILFEAARPRVRRSHKEQSLADFGSGSIYMMCQGRGHVIVASL